jgi:hypothetical protein
MTVTASPWESFKVIGKVTSLPAPSQSFHIILLLSCGQAKACQWAPLDSHNVHAIKADIYEILHLTFEIGDRDSELGVVLFTNLTDHDSCSYASFAMPLSLGGFGCTP